MIAKMMYFSDSYKTLFENIVKNENARTVYLKSYYTNVNAIYEILYTNLYFYIFIINK